MKRTVLVAVLAALALTGCGGDPDPGLTPAGEVQVRLLDDLYAGRFDDVYELLHPAHQRLVSLELFERCSRQTIPVGQLDTIQILDVYDETVSVPALGRQPSKAVRIRIQYANGQSGTFVNHSVEVDDRWVWILNVNAVQAYEADRCPT